MFKSQLSAESAQKRDYRCNIFRCFFEDEDFFLMLPKCCLFRGLDMDGCGAAALHRGPHFHGMSETNFHALPIANSFKVSRCSFCYCCIRHFVARTFIINCHMPCWASGQLDGLLFSA